MGSTSFFVFLDKAFKNESDADASENWYTYNTDYQGSTTSIVGRSGDAVSTYECDDYGSITEETDAIDNEICYTGQYYEEGTGLYYYNARYYDSQNACFTSMDTYRGDNTLPLTLNLYMYCGGNPINFTDPTGHSFWNRLKKFVKKTYKEYVPKKVKRKISKAVSNVKRSNTEKKLYSLKIKATKNVRLLKSA